MSQPNGEHMTWQEMFAAIKAIGDGAVLEMRKPGDWYVGHRGVEVSNRGMLESRYGNGIGPEEAVRDHWRALTELAPHEYLVINAMSETRRQALRWNGYMWATKTDEGLRVKIF